VVLQIVVSSSFVFKPFLWLLILVAMSIAFEDFGCVAKIEERAMLYRSMFIEDSGRVVRHVLQNDIGGVNLISAERNSTAVRLSLRWPRTPTRGLRNPPGHLPYGHSVLLQLMQLVTFPSVSILGVTPICDNYFQH
jgi:hypothetical protein